LNITGSDGHCCTAKIQDPPQEEDDYSADDYDSYPSSEGEEEEEEDTELEAEPQHQQQPRRRQKPRRRQQTQQKQVDDDESLDYQILSDSEDDGSRAMQPFGARAMRGEIQGGETNQGMQMAEKKGSSLDDDEGLKLKLELNLDIEVELKASIHGDLTLSLLS